MPGNRGSLRRVDKFHQQWLEEGTEDRRRMRNPLDRRPRAFASLHFRMASLPSSEYRVTPRDKGL